MSLPDRLAPALALLSLAAPARAESPRAPDGGRAGALAAAEQDERAGALDDQPTRDAHDATRAALHRGLAFLAARQKENQDGSFPKAGGRSHVPIALAALGSLAFMASGSTPDRGPWGRETSLAIDYLLNNAQLGLTAQRGYIALLSKDDFGMHAHGFATVALAEAYTVAPSTSRGQRIAEVLEAATDLIQRSQTTEGGWFYRPVSGIEHENSVTVVQLQALRAARDCGIRVDPSVIAKAIDYIRRCQNEDGRFRYQLDPTPGNKVSLALTAAGLATLQNAGRYEGPEVERAVTAMWSEIIERDQNTRRAHVAFPYYERFYVAIALWTHPNHKLFEEWMPRERARVLDEQRPDGSWLDEQFGACYATAMNCLFLAIEDGLLPLFER